MMTATYSPEDNKLRLYASSRLDAETYERVKASGFRWAPKQDLFVAPAWTPGREDLLIDLCGEIGDEDTSLVDRAEERADRFETYSEKRAAEAHSARASVAAIADNIPLGQPILIGHHSERHARKDAERIENGMRKAVKLWDTSRYWVSRAAGAIRSAKYKERPDVRARRIKGLESEERKLQKRADASRSAIRLWGKLDAPRKDGSPATDEIRKARALMISNVSSVHLNNDPRGWCVWSALDKDNMTPGEAQRLSLRCEARSYADSLRWLAHYRNRLTYERAMLAESGGTVAERTGPEAGGAVRCWASPRGGWSFIVKVNRVSVTVYDNWGNGGRNFTRTIPFDKLAAVMTRAQVEEARADGRLIPTDDGTGFHLADTPPPPTPKPEATSEEAREQFDALRDALRQGVKVVAVNQLFPTPPDVARQMVDLAGIEEGNRVLEPSAGTGNLLGAMGGQMFGASVKYGRVHAVEINGELCPRLRSEYPLTVVHQGDFLTMTAEDFGGAFDRILMNPPFENGADIKHIQHAAKMLNPGGRLVAICANGPRQQRELQPLADEWTELPEGTFTGTGVRTVMLSINREAAQARACVCGRASIGEDADGFRHTSGSCYRLPVEHERACVELHSQGLSCLH